MYHGYTARKTYNDSKTHSMETSSPTKAVYTLFVESIQGTWRAIVSEIDNIHHDVMT